MHSLQSLPEFQAVVYAQLGARYTKIACKRPPEELNSSFRAGVELLYHSLSVSAGVKMTYNADYFILL